MKERNEREKRNSKKGKRKQENVWKDGKNKIKIKEVGKNLLLGFRCGMVRGKAHVLGRSSLP